MTRHRARSSLPKGRPSCHGSATDHDQQGLRTRSPTYSTGAPRWLSFYGRAPPAGRTRSGSARRIERVRVGQLRRHDGGVQRDLGEPCNGVPSSDAGGPRCPPSQTIRPMGNGGTCASRASTLRLRDVEPRVRVRLLPPDRHHRASGTRVRQLEHEVQKNSGEEHPLARRPRERPVSQGVTRRVSQAAGRATSAVLDGGVELALVTEGAIASSELRHPPRRRSPIQRRRRHGAGTGHWGPQEPSARRRRRVQAVWSEWTSVRMTSLTSSGIRRAPADRPAASRVAEPAPEGTNRPGRRPCRSRSGASTSGSGSSRRGSPSVADELFRIPRGGCWSAGGRSTVPSNTSASGIEGRRRGSP